MGFAACVAACSFPSLGATTVEFGGGGGDLFAGAAGNAGVLGNSGNSGTGGGPVLPTGQGIGEACDESNVCRVGLSCEKAKCAASHATPLGSPCLISDECADGLQCFATVCAKAGTGEAGAGCTTDLDCGSGFRCALNGLSLSCVPQGETDIGGECVKQSDCYAGLGCADGSCAVVPPGQIFGTPWKGVECEAPEEGAPVRAYFEVPGAKGALAGDFFRLPFPGTTRAAAPRAFWI